MIINASLSATVFLAVFPFLTVVNGMPLRPPLSASLSLPVLCLQLGGLPDGATLIALKKYTKIKNSLQWGSSRCGEPPPLTWTQKQVPTPQSLHFSELPHDHHNHGALPLADSDYLFAIGPRVGPATSVGSCGLPESGSLRPETEELTGTDL